MLLGVNGVKVLLVMSGGLGGALMMMLESDDDNDWATGNEFDDALDDIVLITSD